MNGPLTLKTKYFDIQDRELIIQYLDEKYPTPQLIRGDVDNRTRLKLLTQYVHKNPLIANELAREADPFVFGDQITIIDLLVADYSQHQPFNNFIQGVINGSLRDTTWDYGRS